MVPRFKHLSLAAWAGIVLGAGLVLRIGLLLAYQPVSYSDTASYRRLAASILEGWARYDGTRTPGYPVFLAAVGPDERVWLVQMGLGLVTSMLLFGMGWLISGKAWFAGLAGLAHTLNLGQLFFEANLITETLATFAVTASLAGTFLWLARPARRGILLAVLVSLSASLAWLVRPLYIYLPFWLLPFLVVERRRAGVSPSPPTPASRPPLWGGEAGPPLLPMVGRGGRGWEKGERAMFSISWRVAAAFLIPSLLILWGWASFIHDRFNVWNLTAMSGYNLVQHTGNYFELLPDEEAALRDTYLKYRQLQIDNTGSQVNAIWDAIPEMQQASGLSFYGLSRKLTDLSLQLIRAHPELYLKYAARGWWLFWRAPVYWSPEAFRLQALPSGLAALILVERIALAGANLLFVVTSLAAAASKRLRRSWGISAPLWCLAGTVWIASVLQTLVDHGDNPRFLVPLQSAVVIWVMWIGVESLRAISARRAAEPQR